MWRARAEYQTPAVAARTLAGCAQRGQALIEAALVAPLLLLLAFAVVGAGRVVQAQAGVAAVASEAARAASLTSTGEEAVVLGTARGWAVARGYWLTNGSLRLTLDAGAFGRGGEVRAVAAYDVALGDVPLLGRPSVAVAVEHVESIDPYRSGVLGGRR